MKGPLDNLPQGRLYGFDIVEVGHDAIATPVLKLSPALDVSPEFRRQFEVWAAERFGWEEKGRGALPMILSETHHKIFIPTGAFPMLERAMKAQGLLT